MFFYLIISTAFSQLCNQSIGYDTYRYQEGDVDPKQGVLWNYVVMEKVNPNCLLTTPDQKKLNASKIELFNIQLILDIEDNITITKNMTAGPTVQYRTDGIKIRVQGLNNMVSYQSAFFTFSFPEHNLDTQPTRPDAELQIFFIQEQIYSLCDVEPKYAQLSFPLYEITEDNAKFNMNFDMTNYGTIILDFKQNITNGLKSDTTSYINYKGFINIPPCEQAQWFVSTQPLFILKEQLEKLLNPTSRRIQQNMDELNYQKGRILFQGDKEYQDYDDTVEWAATWVASIIPCVFFALIVCVYGQYELSNIGRYKRPEQKHQDHELQDVEPLNQEKQLA